MDIVSNNVNTQEILSRSSSWLASFSLELHKSLVVGPTNLYILIPITDGCLYAPGGFDTNTYQASVERLDPRIGRWTTVPPMNNRRSSAGVATLNGTLYCVGGNDGTMCMSNGERFNVRRNTWEPIAAMNCRR